jgi:hypothetical protein
MDKIPKIVDADSSKPFSLIVLFDNGIKKEYDCSRLISSRPEFNLISDRAIFKSAHVDSGGYGISWNDDIDISEYELWNKGKTIS